VNLLHNIRISDYLYSFNAVTLLVGDGKSIWPGKNHTPSVSTCSSLEDLWGPVLVWSK